MNGSFMILLQRIRDVHGRPVHITSGFRCPEHNKFVSSTGLIGPHTTGHAADIGVAGQDAFDLTKTAFDKGITGVGFKQKGPHDERFIHLDNLQGDGRPRIWSY